MGTIEPLLVCRNTGECFGADEPIWRGPSGGMLDVDWSPRFDPRAVEHRGATLWRYREALPIRADENIVTLGEGFTPMIVEEVGGRRVWLKCEHLFPTGSYKDRGASVLISKARELGLSRVVEDSSGNAGAAIAAYGARARIACDIYVPEKASAAKRAQITCFGATLHAIPGTREDTSRAVWSAAQSAYYASHVWNPFFLQGTKTFAYEIVEQLGWEAPDELIIPTGNGTLLLGAYIGFRELREAGVIERLPRLIATQAQRCAPLATRWSGVTLESGPTIAEGVAIADPARIEQCLEVVNATGGAVVWVNEAEIRAAHEAALRRGLCIEPTSAVGLAALNSPAIGDGRIVVPLTGHGLKADLSAAR